MTEVMQFTATGHSRFIDRHLVERLIEDCMQVTIFNNLFTGRPQKSLLVLVLVYCCTTQKDTLPPVQRLHIMLLI
mgnify:CR=1 FL=1|jgi:nucleoside-diphosphate-sugar epimerase